MWECHVSPVKGRHRCHTARCTRAVSGEVHSLYTSSMWDLPEVLEEATFEVSSGGMSPDLG